MMQHAASGPSCAHEEANQVFQGGNKKKKKKQKRERESEGNGEEEEDEVKDVSNVIAKSRDLVSCRKSVLWEESNDMRLKRTGYCFFMAP